MKKEPLVSGIRALDEAKIPVILVDRDVDEGCDYVCFTGTDVYQGAVTSAETLMKAIVGMGGSQEALEAIKEGKIAGTSFQQPEEEGRGAIRLAIRCLKGEKLDKHYMIPCPAITRENAGQFKGQF